MKHKKITLFLVIFTLLAICLTVTAFALPNYGDLQGLYSQVATQLTLNNNYMNLSWLHMAETSFRNENNEIKSILFFTVNVNALNTELLNSDFASSGQTATEYLNLMSLGSMQSFYDSDIWYTNLDAVIAQINAVGEVIVLNSTNETLRSENETLEDDNYLLEAQLESVNEGYSILQDNYDRLSDENNDLKATNEALTSENEELKSENEALANEIINSSVGYYGVVETMRSWFRNQGYSYTTDNSSTYEAVFRNELAINVSEVERVSYLKGETDGLEGAEVAKNSILNIVSAPFYFLSNVFNFEILGINIYSIISLFLTLAILAFFFKRLKG